MIRKFSLILLSLTFACALTLDAQNVHKLFSPDNNIRVDVKLAGGVTYDVWSGDEQVMNDCRLSLDGNVLFSDFA